MYQITATRVHIINVTSGATAAPLRALIDAALAAKTASARFQLKGIMQIALTPAVNMAVQDMLTGDTYDILADIRLMYPSQDPIDTLGLVGAGVCSVEIYLDGTTSGRL